MIIEHSNLGACHGSTIAVSAIVSELSPVFSSPKPQSAPPPPISTREACLASTTLVFNVRDQSPWSHSKEREFSRLAALKALRKASPKDLAELDRFREERRRKKNPMTATEVLFQYRRRELEAKVLANLQEYVAFIEAPRPA